MQNWLDVRLNRNKDESADGVADLVNETTEAWNVFDGVGDSFGDVVSEFEYLPEDSMQLLWRHVHRILRTGPSPDVVEFIHVSGKIAASATRELEEHIANAVDASISGFVLGLVNFLVQVRYRSRGDMICCFTE